MIKFLSFNVLLGLFLLSATALADSSLAKIHEPSDKSLKCIQPEDEMRRNHMNYILHQRDLTMRQGLRKTENSLAKCINCHVEPNKKGEIASIESKEHFCEGCHQYAAVQIDCFQCHADRPQKYIKRNTTAHSAHNEKQKLSEQIEQSLFNADAPVVGVMSKTTTEITSVANTKQNHMVSASEIPTGETLTDEVRSTEAGVNP